MADYRVFENHIDATDAFYDGILLGLTRMGLELFIYDHVQERKREEELRRSRMTPMERRAHDILGFTKRNAR